MRHIRLSAHLLAVALLAIMARPWPAAHADDCSGRGSCEERVTQDVRDSDDGTGDTEDRAPSSTSTTTTRLASVRTAAAGGGTTSGSRTPFRPSRGTEVQQGPPSARTPAPAPASASADATTPPRASEAAATIDVAEAEGAGGTDEPVTEPVSATSGAVGGAGHVPPLVLSVGAGVTAVLALLIGLALRAKRAVEQL